MKLSVEDQRLLDELCRQNNVSQTKVRKLLETVYDYEFIRQVKSKSIVNLLEPKYSDQYRRIKAELEP